MATTEKKDEKAEEKGVLVSINDRQKASFENFKKTLQQKRPWIFEEVFPKDNEEKNVRREGDKIVIDMLGATVELGRNGGFSLPQIHSYRNGTDAAIAADLLLKNQTGNWRMPRGSAQSRELACLAAELEEREKKDKKEAEPEKGPKNKAA